MSVYPVISAGQRGMASVLTAMQTQTAWKDGDTTIQSDSSLNDDPDLVLPVEANANYVIYGYLKYLGSTVGDFKYQLTGPTGATGSWGAYQLGPLGATTSQDAKESLRTTIGAPRSVPSVSTGSGQVIMITGFLRISSTAGNLVVQWSQDTSTAADTTLQSDSFIQLQRVL